MQNLFSLNGKVIILTGGSGFLGSYYMRALRDAGAIVIDWDLKSGIDITDDQSVAAAIENVLEKYGRVDGLVNNAALDAKPHSDPASNWKPYEEFPMDLWERELAVNLTGAMRVTKVVVPYMMRQRFGSIIFVASDLALIAPNNSIYDAGRFKDIAYITSKAGLLGLMRAWASRLGSYNVRVNAFVPGGVFNGHSEEFVKKNGALNMLGRMAEPNEYSGAIIFLLSDASTFMTGSCMVMDGGRTAW
ncbi:MAG: SDR family oxidoreductase [Candidatus Harrisonbacteria bacterium]|nr:SDR family oxidoreductase [Candidatus Harrisonbacteria bacterium]